MCDVDLFLSMIFVRNVSLLSVLGINVTEGHRVDGIVSPEEKPAARERKINHSSKHTCVIEAYLIINNALCHSVVFRITTRGRQSTTVSLLIYCLLFIYFFELLQDIVKINKTHILLLYFSKLFYFFLFIFSYCF